MSNKLENPIIIFQGGGYDGCFWEWNVIALIEKRPGNWTTNPINVTGRAGNRVLDSFRYGSLLRGVRSAKDEGEYHIIKTQKDWEWFNAEYNKGFVRSVARAIEQQCKCDKCGGWFDADEIFHTGYRGDGGIGVQYDDNHCWECAQELHDDWAAKNEWKHLSVKEKYDAVTKARSECSHVPINAVRSKVGQIPAHYYAGEAELY